MKTKTIQVVGLTFVEGYPQNLHKLAVVLDQTTVESPAVVLMRNPDNEHDPNAVEVHIPSLQEGLVGHLPREVAAVVAPMLDVGYRFQAFVHAVRIRDEHPDRPGLDIELTPITKDEGT